MQDLGAATGRDCSVNRGPTTPRLLLQEIILFQVFSTFERTTSTELGSSRFRRFFELGLRIYVGTTTQCRVHK
ncbi:hypothetical protein KC19_VG216200 [Ceratodon purpureus]|uniref:Uncharacterized protein n=1 Tax=Ceratodon purpureus TaxID=3225 RepID=A0A8T0HTM0_CERPU|nr:hypothetical protein KC19_VG216200 [Ceratodon purpureus]